MPELPEVETIRRQLVPKIVGKKLDGKTITGLRRRAKILIIDFSDGSSLIFHLKLTGQLIFNGESQKHTRHVFKFSDGSRLIFNDARKFGWWRIVRDAKEIEQNFGPEALDTDFQTLKGLLKKRPNAKIKLLLMDQKFIAGIGNIYSDEILWEAKIHPLKNVKMLDNGKLRKIYKTMQKILKKGIELQGESFSDYRMPNGEKGGFDKYRKVYRRKGEKCSRCGAVIKRIKTGGRSAHFCPVCQKL